jgi:hypothetical protein
MLFLPVFMNILLIFHEVLDEGHLSASSKKHRRGSTTEDGALRILIVFLYGEANYQRFHGNRTAGTYQFKESEDGDDTMSKTSSRPSATWYNVPEDISNCYRRESIPEDFGIRILIIELSTCL